MSKETTEQQKREAAQTEIAVLRLTTEIASAVRAATGMDDPSRALMSIARALIPAFVVSAANALDGEPAKAVETMLTLVLGMGCKMSYGDAVTALTAANNAVEGRLLAPLTECITAVNAREDESCTTPDEVVDTLKVIVAELAEDLGVEVEVVDMRHYAPESPSKTTHSDNSNANQVE